LIHLVSPEIHKGFFDARRAAQHKLAGESTCAGSIRFGGATLMASLCWAARRRTASQLKTLETYILFT